MSESNKELVERIFQGLNDRNEEIYTELYAPGYGWHFPSNNPKPMSREEEREFVKATWAGFPDLTYTVEETIATDDRVVVRFTASGTHTGDFQGMAPTMRKFESGGLIVMRVKDGKVIEAREEYDMAGMLQQLGAV